MNFAVTCFLLTLLQVPAWSQVPPGSPVDPEVVKKIKIDAIESKEGITGDVIVNDMNPSLSGSEKLCLEEEKPKDDKEKSDKDKELVLIFTGQVNSTPTTKVDGFDIKRIDLSELDITDNKYKNLLDKNGDAIFGFATGISSDPNDKEQILSNFGGLLIFGASQYYDPNKQNDAKYNEQVNQMMATKIKELNLNRDDQIKLISSMVDYLEKNYNDSRNVTPESDLKPRYWTTQANGLFTNQEKMGGVCDDIALMGCQLFQAVNSQEDCFTMHTASVGGIQHFVMLIGEKGTDKYTTINYGRVENSQGENYIKQTPTEDLNVGGGINVRLNRYHDGKHQSVALVKTEYGQWMQQVMDVKGKPGSSLVKDLDGIILQNAGLAFEKNVKDNEAQKQQRTFKVGANQGTLSGGAHVVAVYALLDKSSLKKKMGIGFGYATTFNQKDNQSLFIKEQNDYKAKILRTENLSGQAHHLHINPYFGMGNSLEFKRGNNHFKVHYLNGVYANILMGYEHYTNNNDIKRTSYSPDGQLINQYNTQQSFSYGGIIFDGNLGLSEQAGINLKNEKSGTNANLGIQLTQEMGPSDWGPHPRYGFRVWAEYEEYDFFLNRVEMNAQVKQKIKGNTSLVAGVQTLNSNVGGKYLTELGIELDVPHDMQIYVLTGHGGSTSGFKSQQDFTPRSNTNGLGLRAGVKTNNGINVSGSVRYNQNSPSPVNTQINAVIPINAKKKKKTPGTN